MGKGSSVLIFEFVSGGGIENSEDFEFLISEGFGMLSALIEDFSRLGFHIHTLIDNRIFEQFNSQHIDLIERNQITIAKINSSNQVNLILENIIPTCSYILFIAPENSDILYNLVKMAENLIAPDQTILNLPSNAIATFSDKRKTESFLKSYKISTTNSLDLSSQTISSLPSKEYIVKPFDGVGTSDTYSVKLTSNRIEISSFLRQLLDNSQSTQYIIQEKVQGIPLSSFIATFHGNMTYFTINSQEFKSNFTNQFSINQLEYLGGMTPYTKISNLVKTKVEHVARLICTQFQFTGFFGLDFIYNHHDRTYSIIEINPRITTPYVAISALFQENKSNILDTIFIKSKLPKIKGKKIFKKSTKENKIVLE
jgi:tyramine---L-glutamate ligase